MQHQQGQHQRKKQHGRTWVFSSGPTQGTVGRHDGNNSRVLFTLQLYLVLLPKELHGPKFCSVDEVNERRKQTSPGERIRNTTHILTNAISSSKPDSASLGSMERSGLQKSISI
ncbi:hypothetical protein KIL84_003740 [Mauremys mutica]|uniref:Uncharacterized protein n=1 Tax=Mauremys mutica TaxID=74926 RepID=A0A9D3WWB8_9SAUR|nr:hypothetical protein KIL84_003740 [Mauremys mutica]